MTKQLLIEVIPVEFSILEEASVKNGGRMRISGVFAAADEVNGNGRVYPEAIYDREIGKLQTLIAEHSLYGEADHPGDGRSSIKNTAAILTKVEKQVIDNRKLYAGEAIVLNTEPGGRNLQEIIRAGGKVGVSSRGWGSLVKGSWQGKTADIVQEDLDLKTFDFVIGQSVKGAQVAQMTEQLEVVNLLECGPCKDCKRETRKDETTKGGSTVMEIKTVEELRKAYPDLCEQLVKVAVEQKEKDVKEAMQKDFDARVLKEVETKMEEVKTAVIEEITGSDEYKGMSETLVEIAKLVKPYLSESDEDDDALEGKVEELSTEVATLKGENKALKEQQEKDKKAAEDKAQAKKRIAELTAGKKHERLLVEKLEGCNTVAEVDARFKEVSSLIETLAPEKVAENKETAKGDGKVLNENKEGSELTEEQKKLQSLAGIV